MSNYGAGYGGPPNQGGQQYGQQGYGGPQQGGYGPGGGYYGGRTYIARFGAKVSPFIDVFQFPFF